MLLDKRDLNILRLVGRYRWLPYAQFSRLEFSALFQEIGILIKVGYLGLSQKKRYIKLSTQGYDSLQAKGFYYEPSSKRAFASSSTLRRRLEASSIMLTCLRAGIDVFQDNVSGLAFQPTFYPAFDLRDGEINLMNAANCSGFGHWGDTGYILEYISPEGKGMSLTNELTHLHNFSSLFDRRLNGPLAMIFAGPSYRLIHKQLSERPPTKKRRKSGFVDFGEVYRISDMPIHLLSCDETGAMQLALMRQPDHNARIARASFGNRWKPHDELIPEADGCVDGNPLIIAADMDIRRVERVCTEAAKQGRTEVMVAAFRSQMESFLLGALPTDGRITPLSIEQPVLDAAFGKSLALYSMEDGAGVEGSAGHE